MISSKEDDVRAILDPALTLLVIVDMENEFCSPGGRLYHPEGTDEVIPKLKKLLGRCRHAGTQIFFLRSTRFEHSPEFVRFGQVPIILQGTWASEFIEGITPQEGEPTIEKHTHDCFYKTEMDNLLEKLGIMPETHTIIIGGINANICVYHAVLGFHVRHYRILLPMGCCAGPPEGRKMLEAQMSDPAYSYNVRVTQSELIDFS